MMVLTLCNFRVDEYMETVVAKFSEDRLESVKSAIHSLCAQEKINGIQTKKRPHEDSARARNGTSQQPEMNGDNGCSDLASFKVIMGYYINAMLNHPRIQHVSLTDQNHLRSELQTFLLAHVAQIEDNASFSVQQPQPPSTTAILVSTRRSYYEWTHTVGANSVSCPFSFAFFTCLLGSSLSSTPHPADCFSSIHQNYLARDLCVHLAVMSRPYNDYGSFARDRAEANINSVNFAEFHGPYTHSYSKLNRQEDEPRKEIQLKADLLVLAQYERQMADSVGKKLLVNLRTSGSRKDRSKADGVSLFMGVTALYADIYVARDLSNHVEKA
ncbi:hypothetical protein N7G274_008768 [Stereocaulon virgatum]|uniref:Uncharacterized protein n=1 Tax=Stereocaulon virgatum TaxID=373712 RepID=A0ABR3ZXL9_9LECA